MKFKNMDLLNHKKYIILVIIILCIILLSGIYLVHASSIPTDIEEIEIVEPEEKEEETTIEEDIIEYVLVDIKGAVVNPGVYKLPTGSSVQDSINIAGGLLENANTNTINLSKRVTDEMVIIIYTNEEIDSYQNKDNITTEYVYIEIPCECPDTMNDACISDKTEEIITENDLISINIATIEELMTLKGVGKTKAEAIIEYRKENGNFKDISEIMNVSGIGESAFEKIKDQITI